MEFDLWIIEDLTQTLYTMEDGRIGFGDYLVASTRKWLPVTDGGLLAVRNGVPLEKKTLEEGYDEAVYRQLLISLARDQVEKDRGCRYCSLYKIGKRGKCSTVFGLYPEEDDRSDGKNSLSI